MLRVIRYAAGACLTGALCASAAFAQAPQGMAIPAAAVYPPRGSERGVALFLSGDGGWNLGVVLMAKIVAAEGYTVIGIDFPRYLHTRDNTNTSCINLADDLTATSRALASRHTATVPLLVGYSSGATGVYAALAAAQPGAFAGGLSLGFGPDLETKHPLCSGAGLVSRPDKALGYIYAPRPMLSAPWVVFQGETDQVVSPGIARTFARQVKNASLVMLPHVGHGFSVERNWLPQFKSAIAQFHPIAPAQR